MGVGDPRDAGGAWRFVYEHARAQMLLATHTLQVQAIYTVYVDFKIAEGCSENSSASR